MVKVKIDLREALNGDYPVILDGATGSNLMIAGMPNNMCPEMWIIENEDILINLQREYVKNGSMAVFAPTFGANRASLQRYGLGDKVEAINQKLYSVSKKAVNDEAAIIGDISPSGLFPKPYGDTGFDKIYDIFYEQAKILDALGIDGFIVETQLNLSETRTAVLAIRDASTKPIFATMAVNEHGKTMSGNDVVSCLLALEAVGVDAFGCNCSVGPSEMLNVMKRLKKYSSVPLIAKANAGKPHGESGEMCFDINADEFSNIAAEFVDNGIKIIGGCCGSTPEYIKKISEKINNKVVKELPTKEKIDTTYFASDEKNFYDIKKLDFYLDTDKLPDIAECSDNFEDDIFDAEENEDTVLRVKVNNVSDAETILNSSFLIKMPLMLTSENINALEKVLRLYTGRVIIDSHIKLSDEEKENLRLKYNPVFL